MQWSFRASCPLRVFSQGFFFHTLHGLSDTLKPWKRIPLSFYSSILHDPKASTTRMRPPSLTSTIGWSLAFLNHISGRFCLLLFRSRESFFSFLYSNTEQGRPPLASLSLSAQALAATGVFAGAPFLFKLYIS